VQGAGYSESKVEMGTTAHELETDAAPLELERDMVASASDQVVCLEISKEERYSAN
jgi:hypothetical protein